MENDKDNFSIQSAKDHINASMQFVSMKSAKHHDYYKEKVNQ